MKAIARALLLVFALTLPMAAQAGEPMDLLRTQLDQVLDVLRAPASAQGEAEKKKAIRDISDRMFHWDGLSRMTLGRGWNNLTADQQQEFIALFKDLLERAYIDRILAYKDGDIGYVGDEMLTEQKAEVRTRIQTENAPVEMVYRMALVGGKWGVYDVIVEGVSLSKNYRTQFREILSRKSPAALLEMLREKVGNG